MLLLIHQRQQVGITVVDQAMVMVLRGLQEEAAAATMVVVLEAQLEQIMVLVREVLL